MSQNQSQIFDFTYLTHSLEYYLCTVIGNIGIIANILNIIVCTRKRLQQNTMGFYNILMSSFNILTIIFFGYLTLFSQSIGQEQLLLKSDASCKLISFFNRVFAQMSSWLSVMVTLDRMLCIGYTKRFKFIENKRNLAFIVLGLFAILCFINIPNLFNQVKTQTGTMSKDCKSSRVISVLRDGITILSRFLLPITLQVIISGMLFKVRNRAKVSRSLNKEYKFAFTIIILNLVLIITEFPLIVSLIFVNIYGYNQTFISNTSIESAIASFAYICSYVFAAFIYVSLFFVNFLTNKIYRRECLKTLHIIS